MLRATWIVCSLVVLLTACSGAPAAPASPTPPASPQETDQPAETASAPPPAPTTAPATITLTLWVPDVFDPYGEDTGGNALRVAISSFRRAYPDVQVEIVVKKAEGRGGIFDYLRTAATAAPSVMPDVVLLNAADLRAASGLGLIQPLDSHTPAELLMDRFPFASALGEVDGQTMGFIVAADLEHAVYRPDLYSSPPLSWTAVLSHGLPYALPTGGNGEKAGDSMVIQYLAAGGRLVGRESQPYLDLETLNSVLGFYAAAAMSDVVPVGPVLGLPDTQASWENFQAGQSALAVVQASAYLRALKRAGSSSDETAEMGLPIPVPTRDGNPASIGRGWALTMVASNPDRQAVAALLVNWLAQPTVDGPWMQAAGYLPGTRSALEQMALSAQYQSTLRGLMERAVPPSRTDVADPTARAMQSALEAVLIGNVSPLQAATAAVSGLRP